MSNVSKKQLFSKTFIRRFGGLLTTVLEHCSSTRVPLAPILEEYINFIELRCLHLGPKQAMVLLKEIHLIAMKIAMNRPFEPIRFLKSDKMGIPRVIKPLEILLKSDSGAKRVALSITKLYLRVITVPSTDFSSITKEGTGYQLGTK